jgi:hypothetical protein
MRHLPLKGLFTGLAAVWLALGLSSCCEPAHKDSQPMVIDSTFKESAGRDLDLFGADTHPIPIVDSAYYPVYSVGIQNTGTQDDTYTLSLRYVNLGFTFGFDITKRVPAGQVVTFSTPTQPPDPNATYAFAAATLASDTTLSIDKMYKGIQGDSAYKVEIHRLQPTLTITYGAIDNGPEACNTPASQQQLDVNELPTRF